MGVGSGAVFVGVVALAIVSGTASAVIAAKRDRSITGFFWLGFLLPAIGIAIAAIAAPGEPPAPAGMQAVACPRCNARQNVANDVAAFQCWQCKQTTPLKRAADV